MLLDRSGRKRLGAFQVCCVKTPDKPAKSRLQGAIGRPSLLFDAGSLKPRFNGRNTGIDLFLRQLAE